MVLRIHIGHIVVSSEDLRESFVCCFGHSTFLEHIVTYSTKDKKLFFTGESISLSTSANDLEHLTLGSNHCHESVREHLIVERVARNGKLCSIILITNTLDFLLNHLNFGTFHKKFVAKFEESLVTFGESHVVFR